MTTYKIPEGDTGRYYVGTGRNIHDAKQDFFNAHKMIFNASFIWGEIEALSISNVDFYGCEFNTITFKNCVLECVNFNSCTFGKVNFINCMLISTSIGWPANDTVILNDIVMIGCHISLLRTPPEVLSLIRFNECLFPHNKAYTLPYCAKNVRGIPLRCPETGAFTGWKKVGDSVLVELIIPHDAKRSSAFGNKCRCSKAYVKSITCIDEYNEGCNLSKIDNYPIHASVSSKTTYEVGKMVYPDSWNPNRWEECTHGIHFFMTKQEAIDYNY